jgi:hypothetical protein
MANVPDKPAQRTKFFTVGDRSGPEINEFAGGGGGGGGVGGSALILNKKQSNIFN